MSNRNDDADRTALPTSMQRLDAKMIGEDGYQYVVSDSIDACRVIVITNILIAPPNGSYILLDCRNELAIPSDLPIKCFKCHKSTVGPMLAMLLLSTGPES